MDHLGPTLSAYLDRALEPAERAAAESHLAGCERCRRQLAELRATARLLATVPAARPSRSLVPRLVVVPAWVRPVRSLAAVTSGLFVLVFIASAALATGLGGGGRESLLGPLSGAGTRAAQPAAPKELAATGAPSNVRGLASPAPAPAASFGFAAPQVTAVSPQPNALQDATRTSSGASGQGGAAASSAPAGQGATAGAPTPVPSVAVSFGLAEPTGAQLGPTPLLWLALALASALVAFLAHRRANAA